MVQKLLWLAIAGGLGTISRYLLAGLVQRLTESPFPWGTLAVNGLGCFFFGAIWAITSERFALGAEMRTILLVGFLGAFTTFSTEILGVRPSFLVFWQLGQGRVAWKKRLRVLLLGRFRGACDDTSYGGVVQPQEASCLFVYVLVNVNCLVDLLVGDEIPAG